MIPASDPIAKLATAQRDATILNALDALTIRVPLRRTGDDAGVITARTSAIAARNAAGSTVVYESINLHP